MGTLANRIRSRSFDKQLFNLPPNETKYPAWMEGTWDVKASFNGYIFPNTKVPKSTVVENEDTPGFQQMSILSLADIGPPKASFKMRFTGRQASKGGSGDSPNDVNGVYEDILFNTREAEAGWLGKDAPEITSLEFESKRNPNRFDMI
ncbi:unnamed protein product [Choristocarpus tenellus]